MNRILIIFILITYQVQLSAQKRNAIWCFGDSAGIDFNNPAIPTPFTSGLSPRGSCATIADSLGNLMFYSAVNDNVGYLNGKLKPGMVYNKNHDLMLNGDSLVGGAWYHEMTIIPDPGNIEEYYLFHLGVTTDFGLYYSKVNISLDSGRGEVLLKNIQLDSIPKFDGIQAIKHANGRDWWIIYRNSNGPNNYFYKYLITASGLQYYSIDSVGATFTSNGGDLVFNSSGSQFVNSTLGGLLAIYDFDRCTGQVTLHFTIRQESPGGNYPCYYGCAFSPNDSFLYVTSVPYFSTLDTTQIYLLQFNLLASNVYNSRKIIYNFPYPACPCGIRLAPDNKVYVSTNPLIYPYDSLNYYQSNMYLSEVRNPNSSDTGCHFQPFSFYLGGLRSYCGLPNNPNYDLGPVIGSGCDTILTIATPVQLPETGFNVYYQSGWKTAFINAANITGKKYRLQVVNLNGQIVYASEGNINSRYYTKDLNCEHFASGLYVVIFETEKEKLIKKFVVE